MTDQSNGGAAAQRRTRWSASSAGGRRTRARRQAWSSAATRRSKLPEIDVAIVGAGAAGIGCGVVLRDLGVDCVLLERDTIGASWLFRICRDRK